MPAPRRPKSSPSRKTSVSSGRRPARDVAKATIETATLTSPQLAWIDSIAAAVVLGGGPRFSATEILRALVDAAAGRPIDASHVRNVEDLRVAFGALDLSSVERMLRERPRLEGGLLKALEDSFK